MGQKPAAEQAQASWPQRLRRAALFTLFALVLVVPKTLALRRRRGVWNVLRLVAALLGAFLVAAGRGPELGWLRPAAGLVLILLAVLVPPAEAEKSVDEQARELGALVVVNGGRFRVADGKLVLTRLFVASDRVHALDLKHRLLIEIPLAEVSSLRVEPRAGGWRLRLDWDQTTAEFSYDGFFAEHLARVAETTLLTQLRRELPVLKP